MTSSHNNNLLKPSSLPLICPNQSLINLINPLHSTWAVHQAESGGHPTTFQPPTACQIQEKLKALVLFHAGRHLPIPIQCNLNLPFLSLVSSHLRLLQSPPLLLMTEISKCMRR